MKVDYGFTLIELMIVVALLAIGAVLAVPSLSSMIHNNRAAAQANEFVGAINLARSEAVKLGGDVTVCARASNGTDCSGGNSWSNGWLVFSDTVSPGQYSSTDDKLIKVFPALSSDSDLTATNSSYISFRSDGFLDPAVNAAGPSLSLSVSGCTGDQQRQININLQGRASVNRNPCP